MYTSVSAQGLGQIFEDGCFDLVWKYTEGQPWQVNALGFEVTFKMKENRDYSVVITSQMIRLAKENLIKRPGIIVIRKAESI